MADVMDRCQLNLKQMKIECKIYTNKMISQIKQSLQSKQQKEWSLKKTQSGSQKNAFENS